MPEPTKKPAVSTTSPAYPKFLQHLTHRSKIAFSLGTKDWRQANLRALKIHLSFEDVSVRAHAQVILRIIEDLPTEDRAIMIDIVDRLSKQLKAKLPKKR